MYNTYKFRCIECKQEEQRFIRKEHRNDQYCPCGSVMIRLPSPTKTTFKFNDRT